MHLQHARVLFTEPVRQSHVISCVLLPDSGALVVLAALYILYTLYMIIIITYNVYNIFIHMIIVIMYNVYIVQCIVVVLGTLLTGISQLVHCRFDNVFQFKKKKSGWVKEIVRTSPLFTALFVRIKSFTGVH